MATLGGVYRGEKEPGDSLHRAGQVQTRMALFPPIGDSPCGPSKVRITSRMMIASPSIRNADELFPRPNKRRPKVFGCPIITGSARTLAGANIGVRYPQQPEAKIYSAAPRRIAHAAE